MAHSPSNKRSLLALPFVFFWRVLSWIRTVTLNLIFLFLVLVVIAAILTPEFGPLPDKAPLMIAPKGSLVDQYTYISPEDRLLNGSGHHEVLVRDLIKVIEYATHDSRISGLILGLDHFQGGGLSKIQEVGAAIDAFKESGKPVVAFADNYSQQQYYLASYANDIYMHDLGNIAVTGFGLYRNYYKQAIDKLELNFHVFKVGQFKDFVEPYIRDSMSDASRKHNQQWLSELWQNYSGQVEKRRELAAGALTQWINHMADQLAATEGDTAKMALDLHLVDHIGSRVERTRKLIERFGHKPDSEEELEFVDYAQYSHQVLAKKTLLSHPNLALIVARGTILDGDQPDGAIGGDSLSKVIRQVRDSDDIKALVLRIDSGGGSAFASELIRQELQAVRDKGIPIVVSMGSVAASGGYWIAMAADEIWATPTTITGSIGVFGFFPTLEKSLAKIGVSTDGVGTTDLAGALRLDRPLSLEAGNILQQGVEHIYDRFIHLVAANRNSTPEAIHEIAQGRVWSGQTAKKLGLVDQLGGLNDAITAAASRANLAEYEIKLFERELSPKEQLIKQLMSDTNVSISMDTLLQDWTGVDLSVFKAIQEIIGVQSQWHTMNAPRSTYAVCLDCIAP